MPIVICLTNKLLIHWFTCSILEVILILQTPYLLLLSILLLAALLLLLFLLIFNISPLTPICIICIIYMYVSSTTVHVNSVPYNFWVWFINYCTYCCIYLCIYHVCNYVIYTLIVCVNIHVLLTNMYIVPYNWQVCITVYILYSNDTFINLIVYIKKQHKTYAQWYHDGFFNCTCCLP